MSANNVSIHTVSGYNFYTITENGKKYVIGGVPYSLKDSYIAEASDASAIILLTSKPEFVGGVAEVVAQNPDIEVYATPAGLRNIKEIINSEINEKLIKDEMELDKIKFIVTPGLPWVDTVSAVYQAKLFSGELFSGDSDYYALNLKINRDFVVSALDRISGLELDSIYPSKGDVICDIKAKLCEYRELTEPKTKPTRAAVIYSSEYGFTKSVAEYIQEKLSKTVEVYFSEAETADIQEVKNADMLVIGTNTINRNAPKSIWDIVTSLDLVNKRSTPYFVFGSFGWAGDGIKLVDKTLEAMGMQRVSKPIEVLFAPADKDFEQTDKAIAKLISAIL